MRLFRNQTRSGVMIAVVLSLLNIVGCGKSEPPPAVQTTPPAVSSDPQISANPNPVPAGPDNGSTTITWNAGPSNTGEVYLVTRDGTEKLFAGASPRGSQEAPFIGTGWDFEFRLYEGNEHKKILASVKVSREKSKD